jgi:hypothetical protein
VGVRRCALRNAHGPARVRGEDIGETLAEVIKANVNWEALPADTPSAIRRLLKRCLVKDRKARISDAGVARLEVDDAVNELRVLPVSQTSAPRSRQWLLVLIAATALGTAALSGIAVWRFGLPALRPDRIPKRFVIDLPTDVRITPQFRRLAISRDGRRIVYAAIRGATTRLYSRSIDRLESMEIPDTEGAGQVFLSPDGEWVGYNDSREAKIKKVRAAGGAAATICSYPIGATFGGAAWSTRGTIVFATSASPALMEVSDAGGTPRPLTKPTAGETHFAPSVLPDDNAVLLEISRQGKPDGTAVVRLDSGQTQFLFEGSSSRFAATGHILFVRERALWAVPFDSKRLAMAGDAVPVVEDIGLVGARLGASNFDIADNGTLVYVPATATSQGQRTLTWVDRQGHEEPIGAPPRAYWA